MSRLRRILDLLSPVGDLRRLTYSQCLDGISREEAAMAGARIAGTRRFHRRRRDFLRERAAYCAIRLPISGF